MSTLRSKYRNMTNCRKAFSKVINGYNTGDVIDNPEILQLLTYHPVKSLDISKLEYVKIDLRPPYNSRSLFYKYKNSDTIDDISWCLCIRNLYGKFKPDEMYLQDVKRAFRNESHMGSKQRYHHYNTYRQDNQFVGMCCNCNIVTDDITTDHYPTPYKQTFTEFIKEHDVKLSTVQIYENNKNEMKLKDKCLATKWLQYHDEKSTYRLLCRSCNSAFGSYGY